MRPSNQDGAGEYQATPGRIEKLKVPEILRVSDVDTTDVAELVLRSATKINEIITALDAVQLAFATMTGYNPTPTAQGSIRRFEANFCATHKVGGASRGTCEKCDAIRSTQEATKAECGFDSCYLHPSHSARLDALVEKYSLQFLTDENKVDDEENKKTLRAFAADLLKGSDE